MDSFSSQQYYILYLFLINPICLRTKQIYYMQ